MPRRAKTKAPDTLSAETVADLEGFQEYFRNLPQPSDREFTHWIERRRLMFIETSNPLWAWEAFRICRSLGRPAPEWFLSYLTSAAYDIEECQTKGYYREDSSIDAFYEFILRSLGFKRYHDKGGPGKDALAMMERERVAYDVAARILVYRHFGHKLVPAIEYTATYFKMPPGTARAYWYRYRAVVEAGDRDVLIARVTDAGGFAP